MSKTFHRPTKHKTHYVVFKNHYSKFSGRCRCGAWLPKGSWVRLKGKEVVACVECREGKNHDEVC